MSEQSPDAVRDALMAQGKAASLNGAYRGPQPQILQEADWPWDTVDGVFFHRALEPLLAHHGISETEGADEAAVEKAFREVIFAPQRDDLKAVSQTVEGLSLPIWTDRWKAQAFVATAMVTGQSQQQRAHPLAQVWATGWIYITKESLDRYLSNGPDERSVPWHPSPDDTLKDWCAKPAPPVEALARSKKAANPNPSGAQLCRVLALMWQEAGRGEAKWETIEQYRNANRLADRS